MPIASKVMIVINRNLFELSAQLSPEKVHFAYYCDWVKRPRLILRSALIRSSIILISISSLWSA